ncbi:hypothetical protein ACFLQQ_02000 [Actinomycetota bacterium]
MKRVINKSFRFFTLLTVIMLSSVFLLPSMLFADSGSGSVTYEASGLPADGISASIEFTFDVTSVPKCSKTATLDILVDDVDYPSQIDEVYFIETDSTEHYLGIVTIYSGWFSFDIDVDWIKEGTNTVRYEIDPASWYTYIDDSNLTIDYSCKAEPEVEPVWVRDVDMTCYQVWVNEDGCFEFVFWWEYENNNWVKIYDMAGNGVFSIDMTKGKANFVACLPDGMYKVQTFHEAGHILQEFMIGKPAPEM